MNLTKKEILDYKKRLKVELINQGAKKSDFLLLTEQTIINSIKQNRDPKDVAWAIIQ